jgi:phosphotransferase system enzyme I (PtsI)
MALGTAVVARQRGGVAFLPDAPPSVAALVAEQRFSELPDVILVAAEYQTALTLAGALTWGRVVGIAAEMAAADAPVSSLPAVVHLTGLLETVEDDQLMLVDAERGVALADPDGAAIAQYQAEYDRIAPKRRLFLESEHLPAQTLDGRAVQVIARILSWDDVALALDAGADALYLPFNSFLLPANADTATQRRSLFALADQAGGKLLILSDDYALTPMAVVEAAQRAELMLAVPPRVDLEGWGLGELLRELHDAEAECFDRQIPAALPRLAAELTLRAETTAERIEGLAAQSVSRLVFGMQEETLNDRLLSRLEPLITAAASHLLPVIVATTPRDFPDALPDDPEAEAWTAVRALVGAGVSGMLVGPERVGVKKAMIRELSYSECRETLLGRLSALEISA